MRIQATIDKEEMHGIIKAAIETQFKEKLPAFYVESYTVNQEGGASIVLEDHPTRQKVGLLVGEKPKTLNMQVKQQILKYMQGRDVIISEAVKHVEENFPKIKKETIYAAFQELKNKNLVVMVDEGSGRTTRLWSLTPQEGTMEERRVK